MKIKKIFEFPDFNEEDIILKRMFNIIIAFSFVGMLAFLFFTFINTFILKNYLLAYMDLALFILSFIVYVDLRKNRNMKRSAIIILMIVVVFTYFIIYRHIENHYGLIWSLFFPLLALPLLGAKQGLRVTIVYYIVFIVLLSVELHYEFMRTSGIRLITAAGIIILILYSTEKSLEKMHEALEKQSFQDSLTKLYNRRKIDIKVAKELVRYNRYKSVFSMAIIDLDDFKNINDSYGHDIGDSVLVNIASILSKNSRQSDFIGRWGGEEFIILMTNTNLDEATKHLLNIKYEVENYYFNIDDQITCSIGICEVSQLTKDDNKLFICVDKALYKAKESGKNMIVTENGQFT